MKILVIDDEDSSRVVTGALLDLLGHETVMAESGEEGLHILATEPFDLILLDLYMQGMNGLEVCEKIRKRNKRIKIVLMSGSINIKDLEQYVGKYSILKLVQKPIKTNLLKDLLDNV